MSNYYYILKFHVARPEFKMAAPSEEKHVEPGTEKLVPFQPLEMSTVLGMLIGEDKRRYTTYQPHVGIPSPPRSPEEARIAAIFESCAFKTTLSCVAGAFFTVL